jgi:hypothetical protein
LAYFIRKHQRSILNVPFNERFTRVNTTNPGYQRLMRLSIPTEDMVLRGWVTSFSLSKKGVFDPAPDYTFNFFVVFDGTAASIGISHRIKKFYDATDYAAGVRQVPQEKNDVIVDMRSPDTKEAAEGRGNDYRSPDTKEAAS